MASEENEYVAQLREVFDSCDTSGTGLLDSKELLHLCQKLQLEDQAEALVNQLIGDSIQGRVEFDAFKEGFVSVLSNAVDDLNLSSSEDEEESSERKRKVSGVTADEVPAKYVKGDKKYGRRSKPDILHDTDADYTTDFSDTDFSLISPVQTPKPSQMIASARDRLSSIDSAESANLSIGYRSPENSKSPLTDSRAETFEAEGVMNQSMANIENALDPVSEEEHLKSVWKELGVGRSGYLTVDELAKVCDHIGMDEMNEEELQHLFDKLDVDQDGSVSFEEFLHGLFQHGGPNPSTPVRPVSAQKQKLRLTMSMEDRLGTQTPSIIAAIAGSGIFSSLDFEGNGYAQPEEIIEMWGNLGISTGAEILEGLEFDMNTKINLQELSIVLEQELVAADEQNAVFQVAVASYQTELKHLKFLSEQMTTERDKLKTEVAEANQRNALLIKEADERHSNIEKTNDKKLQSIERKHLEQIKNLQNEIEKEQEMMTSQAAKQKRKMEAEIDSLKEEEIKSREKLIYEQQYVERLEKEMQELSEKCVGLEKETVRQKRDLDSVADLHRKLEEMESNRDLINNEQHRFAMEKLKQYEHENKELRDKNDELTMEIETVKQELATNKRRRRRGTRDSNIPRRNGSVLSDYQKPDVKRRNSGISSTENSDEDDTSIMSTPSRQRRRLPSVKKESEDPEALTKLKMDIDKLKTEKDQEIRTVKLTMEEERKEMEQAFKFEITDMMETHQKEMNDIMQGFRTEKEQIRDECESEKETLLKRIKQQHDDEKHDLIVKHASEKNLLEQKFAEDKLKLTERLHAETEDEIQARISDAKENLLREKEDLELSLLKDHDDYEQLVKQKAEMELKLKLVREEMQMEFNRQRKALLERFDQEKSELEEKHRMEIYDYENAFVQGPESLKGKLKEDFYSMLDQYKEEVILAEKSSMLDTFQRDKDELEELYHLQKAELSQAFTSEKYDLDEKHQIDLEESKRKHKDELKRHQDKMATMQDQFQDEKEKLEKKLADEIKEQIEDEFVDQMERIRTAFQEEREELERQIHALEDENMMLRETDDQGINEAQLEIERLNREIDMLRDENEKAEQTVDDLKDHFQEVLEENNENTAHLEKRIQELQLQKLDAKEEVLRENFIEKDKLDNVEHEKALLKEQLKQTEDKLIQSNANLSLAESQHFRKVQHLRDLQGNMIDANKYNNMILQLSELKQKNKELEEALEMRASETTKLLLDSENVNKQSFQQLKLEKKELEQKLRQTRSLLNEHVEKYKKQLEKSTRSDVLVKDLYIENSDLMNVLYVTEKRQKIAEKNKLKLEEKCVALQKLLCKICPVALR